MTQMTMGGAGASKASGVLEEASCCRSGALAQQKKRPTFLVDLLFLCPLRYGIGGRPDRAQELLERTEEFAKIRLETYKRLAGK